LGSEKLQALDQQWQALRSRFTRRGKKDTLPVLQRFLETNNRAFCIETGRIEGLYQLARGLTEQLLEHGFDAISIGPSQTDIAPELLRAHLEDQQGALDMVFDTVAQRRPLSHGTLCEWHACIMRSQEHAPGRAPDGRRVAIPLLKGAYKKRPNNPFTPQGILHEYCPPEQVRSELDRLFALHARHREAGVPTEVEASWLHHRFVQIHPFQDGNGRMARLLVAYLYAQEKHWPLPVIYPEDRMRYFDVLAYADEGDLSPFVEFLATRTYELVDSMVKRTVAALEEEATFKGPSLEMG